MLPSGYLLILKTIPIIWVGKEFRGWERLGAVQIPVDLIRITIHRAITCQNQYIYKANYDQI